MTTDNEEESSTSVDRTWVNLNKKHRDIAERVARDLRAHHGGRSSISRGVRHVIAVYERLPEEQRHAMIVADETS